MVPNRDAGFVHPGRAVTVKLKAYPLTRYGVVPAVLETISRDAMEDKQKGLVYQACARLLQDYVMVDGKNRSFHRGLPRLRKSKPVTGVSALAACTTGAGGWRLQPFVRRRLWIR